MDITDPRALRDAFGSFMTGVTVVTTIDANGQPLGFTANSFSSVSLSPPLLLVCVSNTSSNYDTLKKASGFAVNILADHQKEVSNTFARPVDDRFSAVEWNVGPYGSPVLEGVSAWFDCSKFNSVDAGDHTVLIGKVEAFETSTAPGLGYVRGAYVTPAAEAEALSDGLPLVVSALIERGGEVLLIEDEQDGLALPEAKVGKKGATSALARLIDASGISFLCQAGDGEPSSGSFIKLTPEVLQKISNADVNKMLTRFERESRIGNYGTYFRDMMGGKIRSLGSEN